MAAMGGSVVIFTCLLVIAISAAKEYVPVLLLQSSDSASNEESVTALSKWNANDFKKYVLKLVNRNQEKSKPPLVMVFAEESLSVEDFSWASEEDYGSYPRLLNESKSSISVFFPSIHQPLKALQGLRDSGFDLLKYPSAYVAKLIASGKEASIFSKVDKDTKGIILVIDLEDASTNEDRPDMLRRHDSFIVDVYEKMKTGREVLLVYTADHSSWYEADEVETVSNLSDYEDDDAKEVRSSGRHLLAVTEADNGNQSYVIYHTANTLLYSGSHPILIYTNASDRWEIPLNGSSFVSMDTRATFLRMTINYKQDQGIMLHLKFGNLRGYWNLSSIELEQNNNKVTLYSDLTVEAPVGFSYHCSQNVSFKNDSYEVLFQGLQVQTNISGTIRFGDGYDCVYFFTAAIWSGLFVTMLLAFIMIWGLSMIMDIRTMDRFDDPKGKTITIANAE